MIRDAGNVRDDILMPFKVPMFRGEKMAMSLPSPMIGNSTGVKANNGFIMADDLRFHLLVLTICCATEIRHFSCGRIRPVR
jgi:hypothetical protein